MDLSRTPDGDGRRPNVDGCRSIITLSHVRIYIRADPVLVSADLAYPAKATPIWCDRIADLCKLATFIPANARWSYSFFTLSP